MVGIVTHAWGSQHDNRRTIWMGTSRTRIGDRVRHPLLLFHACGICRARSYPRGPTPLAENGNRRTALHDRHPLGVRRRPLGRRPSWPPRSLRLRSPPHRRNADRPHRAADRRGHGPHVHRRSPTAGIDPARPRLTRPGDRPHAQRWKTHGGSNSMTGCASRWTTARRCHHNP